MNTHSSITGLHLEALEGRTLFSQFGYDSTGELLGLHDVIHQLNNAADGFGAAVAGLGDIDNDGTPDFAVSAIGAGGEDPTAGEVFIYSGRTGDFIRSFSDGFHRFGASLANVGDVNNDGVPDLLVGSERGSPDPFTPDGRGMAYVYSGADGSVLHTLGAPADAFAFGHVVLAAPDIDEDGVNDLIVSAPGTADDHVGAVFIFSGADGTVIRTIQGIFGGETIPGDRFGSAVAVLHMPDTPVGETLIAIGAPGSADVGGRVDLFNALGELQTAYSGNVHGTSVGYGTSVALVIQPPSPIFSLPVAVLLVGVPSADGEQIQFSDFTEQRGRVDVYDTTNGDPFALAGQIMGDRIAGARLGEALFNVGDIDGSGSDDFITLAPGSLRSAQVKTFLNARAFPDGSQNAHPLTVDAITFANIGDIDGDGIHDLLMGDGAGHARVISSAALSDIDLVGSTPDFSTAWFDIGQRRYVRDSEGVIRPLSAIPGLTTAEPGDLLTPVSTIVDVTPDGHYVFFNAARGAHPLGALRVTTDSGSVALSELVETVVGDVTPNYEDFRLVEVAANGLWIINESGDLSGRAWAYADGTLTLLWEGEATDVNASGQIVGNRRPSPGVVEAVLWTDGTIVILEGIESPGAINDNGVVLGLVPGTASPSNPASFATWLNGVVTNLGISPPPPGGMLSTPNWFIMGFSNDGRIIASLQWTDVGMFSHTTPYIVEPSQAPQLLADLVHGGGIPTDPLAPVAFREDGSIVIDGVVIIPIADTDITSPRADSPVVNITTPDGAFAAFVNGFGELILRSNTGEGWTTTILAVGVSDLDPVQLVIYTDPMEGNAPYLVLSHGGSMTIYSASEAFPVGSDVHTLNFWSNQDAIVRGITTFTNSSGVVHIAGMNVAGEVVMYFRSLDVDPLEARAWTFENLSTGHIAQYGLATPDFVGDLTAFGTPWGGMNINGIDSQGSVYSIWWAPQRSFWHMANLTLSAQAETLQGQITSFATSWDTMHINGVDANGDLVAIWWAADLGWRHDTLISDGVALDASSLTSFTTPWGGLNIAGRDAATGEVVVYWWSPESNEWRDEPLAFRDSAESPTLRGRLSSHVSAEGVMSIAAAGADSTAYRFSWQPGDAGLWNLEDLTELAG